MRGQSLLKASMVLPILVLLCSVTQKDNLVLVDKVVAKVNDHIILLSEVEVLHIQTFGDNGGREYISKQEVLNRLVESRLVVSQVKEEGILLNVERLNQELKYRLDYFIEKFGSIAALESYFGKNMREIKADLRKQIGEQILVQDISSKVVANLQVTPSQVVEFYERIPDELIPESSFKYEMIELSTFVLISDTVLENILKGVLAIKNLALSKCLMLEEIVFESTSLYNVTPESVKNISWVIGSSVAPVYESRVLLLPVGRISDIIVEREGVYLVQVIDKDLPNIKVVELFFPFDYDSYIDQTKLQMEEIKRKYFSCAQGCTFDKFICKELGETGLSFNKKNLSYDQKNLPSEVYDAFEAEGLFPGAVSRAVACGKSNGNIKVKIFIIDKIVSPHKLSLIEDYDRISAMCLESEREKIFSSWMKKVEKSSFVWIDTV